MLPTMKACAASSYLSSDAKALSTICIIMWVEVAHIRGEPKSIRKLNGIVGGGTEATGYLF